MAYFSIKLNYLGAKFFHYPENFKNPLANQQEGF